MRSLTPGPETAGAGAQAGVQQQQPRSVVSDHFQVVDYLGEALLFFDLLVDEPLQEDVGRVVAFLQGQLVQTVYTGRDLLLVFERHPHHRRYGLELQGWLPDGLEHDAAPSVGDEVEQLQGVREFLAVLELQPVREAAQAARVAEGGHGKVQMGGVELAVDLFVNRVL